MISVCMATFNGEKYVEQQILSILQCLHDEDELIICDDNSTDKTIEIVRSIKDHRMRLYLNHSSRLGVVKNFERALNYAEGKYIFLSDQDDIWFCNKILVMKKYLEISLLVICNAELLYEETGSSHHEKDFFSINRPTNSLYRTLFKYGYPGCMLAFHRSLIQKALPFPKKIVMHDYWLSLLATSIGKVSIVDQQLMRYRIHDNNVSNTVIKKNKRKFLEKVYDRIYAYCCLIVRVWLK